MRVNYIENFAQMPLRRGDLVVCHEYCSFVIARFSVLDLVCHLLQGVGKGGIHDK
jgi:hypothetical protein